MRFLRRWPLAAAWGLGGGPVPCWWMVVDGGNSAWGAGKEPRSLHVTCYVLRVTCYVLRVTFRYYALLVTDYRLLDT